MAATHDYAGILENSRRVGFRLDDVLAEGVSFDFRARFLPESMVQGDALAELGPDVPLKFNQVRAHTYLSMFGLVEEFIVPFVLDHARGDLSADRTRTRALLGFAAEEAKHIELFERFRRTFERGFGTPCDVIGPPDAIARAVLSRGPLGVGLTILHIEWMTQRHYVDSVKNAGGLEPHFTWLLKNHWLEEAQHVRLDTAIVEELARELAPREIEAGIEEYLQIVGDFSALLDQQLELEIASLVRALGRDLTHEAGERLRAIERPLLFRTFLGAGMTHPRFLATLGELSPTGAARVRAVSHRFH